MENQAAKTKGGCDDAVRRLMEAVLRGDTYSAEKILAEEFIGKKKLFVVQSAAQAIGRELTLEELERIAEVCTNKDTRAVVLHKIELIKTIQ